MKAVIKGIVLLLVALVVVIVAGAYLLPSVIVVERTATIAAAPEKVFAIAGNLKRFNEWSPWASIDPATAYTYDGPEQGVGQKMSWASNDPNVGKGSQTIVESVPPSKVVTELDFGEMGKSLSTMMLEPEGSGTKVTWQFRAEANGVMERWMGLMFDRWIGADYARGLENLGAAVAREPVTP